MTMTDTTKSKRGPISFHTLYDRRLAKKGWTWMTYYDVMESYEGKLIHRLEAKVCQGHQPVDGPTRMASVPYEILDYPNSRFGRIEAMVPDLCLVFPRPVAEPISKYCNDAGIPFELGYHRFLVRYTTPSGRSRWVNDWFLFVLMFENVGDQMILKIMFPELR